MFGFNPLIDTFFVISGMLFSYSALKKYKKILQSSPTIDQIWTISLELFANRYLRLVPFYFVIFWFKKSVLIYLGSGPMWDHGFNQNTPYGQCKQESWLTPFTPAAAYMRFEYQCLYQTWSLGCEIFFLFAMVPVTIVLAKKPRLGMIISVVLGLGSFILMFSAFFKIDPLDLKAINAFTSITLRLTFQDHNGVYRNAHLRLPSILSGLVSGYVLYCYKKNLIKDWPNRFTNHATKIAIVTLTFDLFIYYTIPMYVRYGLHHIAGIHVYLQVTTRIGWALASCILLLPWLTDCRYNFNILTGKFVHIMCKINFAALLIHIDILYMKHIQTKSHLSHHSSIKGIDIALISYLYSFAIGAILHIFIESPLNRLRQAMTCHLEKDLTMTKKYA